MEVTDILCELLERADLGGSVIVDEPHIRCWPEGALEVLERQALVVPASNACGVICDECDERCWIEPELRQLPDGEQVLVGFCEHRGHLYFSPEQQRRWQLDLTALCKAVARSLRLRGKLKEIVPGHLWRLGTRRMLGRRRRFYVGCSLMWDQGGMQRCVENEMRGEDCVLLMPASSPQLAGCSIVRLNDRFRLDEDGLHLQLDACDVPADRRRKRLVGSLHFPVGVGWENVSMALIDNDSLRISMPGLTRTVTFAELGMVDARKRDPKPNAAWIQLLQLAVNEGQLSWGSAGASEAARARMKLLRKHLREAFGTERDPIVRYRSRRGWRTLFTIRDCRQGSGESQAA